MASGFGANVTITNLDPLTNWTLTWTYSAGQTVTQAWNTTLTQSGAAVTAKNVSSNGAIATNGTASFGFNGSWTASNPAPTSFALNGVACTGGTAPTTAPADITVNGATRYQTIDGFGAATPIWGGTWSTAETQTLVGMGANQLGLSIVRTGISPVSGEWSTQVNALKTFGGGMTPPQETALNSSATPAWVRRPTNLARAVTGELVERIVRGEHPSGTPLPPSRFSARPSP